MGPNPNLPVMTSLLSKLSRWFGGNRCPDGYQMAELYVALRSQILQLKAEQLGLSTDQDVVAVLMETGYPEAVATLVAVADGSASLYFSFGHGGGIIGSGTTPEVNAAARKLVANSVEFKDFANPTAEYPLPLPLHTRFYIVSQDEVRTVEAPAEVLGCNRHPMSPLFHIAHELITQIRLLNKKQISPGTVSPFA